MKSFTGQNPDMEPSTSVETYWVLDVFGQNDKTKRKSRRPPTYNVEEYVQFLRQLTCLNNNTTATSTTERLYGNAVEHRDTNHQPSKSRHLQPNSREMTSKQPLDVSDVLRKLRQDLTLSFVSFSKEFASEICDGISLLMDVLRAVQMVQNELTGTSKNVGNVTLRENRRSLLRRATSDELEILLCLYQLCLSSGHVPGKDHGCTRLLNHNGGFYGLALSLVSNLTKTRSLSLQLMTALCKMTGGHSRVSEALTTLRLNMGEPVRLKLLSGIVNSAASRVESLTELNQNLENLESSLRFLVEVMAFLNAFVQSAPDLREKIVIQWEVEEAGLNIHVLTQVANSTRNPLAIQLKQELALWMDNHVDVSLMLDRLSNVTSTNEALRKDLQSLRARLQDLENEKRKFAEFENDMKRKCQDLEQELAVLREKTTPSETSNSSAATSVPSPETFNQQQPVADEQSSPVSKDSASVIDDEEFDFTIEDVIEELNNIVNSAESDMNTDNSSVKEDDHSVYEEPLVATRVPKAPPKPRSKSPFIPVASIELGCDLNGETSDFPTGNETDGQPGISTVTAERDTKKASPSRTFFDHRILEDERMFQSKDTNINVAERDRRNTEKLHQAIQGSSSLDEVDLPYETDGSSDDVEEKIQPDILRTIPSRLFQKSWNVLEARSPLYMEESSAKHPSEDRFRHFYSDDMLNGSNRDHRSFSHHVIHLPRETDRSPADLADFEKPLVNRNQCLFYSPNLDQRLCLTPDDRAVSLGDLQVGDVFSFPYHASSVETMAMKKNQRLSYDFEHGRPLDKPRHSFGLSQFIPNFIKSSFLSKESKSSKENWQQFQTEKALMKDYRQHFQQRIPVRNSNTQGMDDAASYWPPTFQAMPFRNIPNIPTVSVPSVPSPSDRMRPIPLPSPTMLARGIHMQMNSSSKLMDHPSGLY